MTLSTDTPHPFDGIPSTLDTTTEDALYANYLGMRDGTVPVVALAPSDASGARPHFDRTAGLDPAQDRGTYYCPRCADRGHVRAVHVRDMETCHDDGWKAATVEAVKLNADPATAKRAQAWLSRWSPASVLTVGCRTCNAEDEDWGSASMARQCGVDCC